MNGLKIYLRSKVTMAYNWAQLLVIFCLLLDGILQLQYIHAPLGKTLTCFAVALGLLASFSFWKYLRKRMRYLPGMLIAFAGAVIIWSTWDEVEISDLPWPLMLYCTGWAFVVAGFTQLFVDGERWMSLSSRSVRLKKNLFAETRHSWDKVSDILVEDTEIQLHYKNGVVVKVQPERCDMQHLRSRVNLILRTAQAAPNSEAAKDDLMGDMFGA